MAVFEDAVESGIVTPAANTEVPATPSTPTMDQTASEPSGGLMSSVPQVPPVSPAPVSPTPPVQGQVVAPPTEGGLSYVDQAKSTVAGQLGTLLGSDNPYITQARARAEEKAAGRGLLSSSIAGRAGEEAAIRAGIEVASQDAGTYAAAQAREQAGEIAQTQTQLEGNITRTLQDAGYASKEQLQQAAIEGNQEAITLQGQIQKERDTFAAGEAVKMQNLQADLSTKLEGMGIDALAADRYSASLASLTNNTLGVVNNIINNIDIGDVTAAMNSLKSFLGDTELGKSVYDTDFSLV